MKSKFVEVSQVYEGPYESPDDVGNMQLILQTTEVTFRPICTHNYNIFHLS